MKNIKPVKISLVLRPGRFRGSSMHLQVLANQRIIHVEPADAWAQDVLRLDFNLDLPLALEFVVTGKHQFDTTVGPTGEILEDRCVVVEHMAVGGIWLKKWYLESRAFQFQSHCGDVSSTNYFGQNGVARFHIAGKDLLDFWLDTMCVDD